jgi:hypothetical protein
MQPETNVMHRVDDMTVHKKLKCFPYLNRCIHSAVLSAQRGNAKGNWYADTQQTVHVMTSKVNDSHRCSLLLPNVSDHAVAAM